MLRGSLVLSAMLLLTSTSIAAEPRDLADLFPAGTLAYAEIGNPAATSDAVAAFLKGTILADGLTFSHDRRDAMRPPGALGGLAAAGELGLLVSPEMLADLKKLGGVAAGLTGFDAKTGRPNVAVAVVLGDGAVAGLLARRYLLTAPDIRRVGKVEGVAVYQNRGLTGSTPDENGKAKPVEDPVPPQGFGEATYLYAPGIIVVGSSVPAVGDVYRRFAGLEKTPGHAASAILKAQSEARKKAGVFFAVDAAALESQIAAAKKVSDAEWPKSEALAMVRFLLDPKQVESLTGSFRLSPDGWALTANAEVKAGGTCPLLALLSGVIADADDRSGAFTVAFPPKEKRASAILGAADAIAQAMGQAGRLPGERVAQAKKKDFDLAGDWLPLVRSAALHNPAAVGPNAKPAYAVLVLTLEGDAAAKAWLGIVPRVSQLISGAEKLPDPASETIRNVKVWGLVHDGVPYHYAVAGARLILGHDRDAVAAIANAPTTAGAKAEGDAALLFRLAFAAAWGGVRRDEKRSLPFWVTADGKGTLEKEWTQALAAMPAVALEAKGSGQILTVRIAQKDLKKPLAKWLELLWQNIEQAPEHDPSGRIHGGILQLRGRSAATRNKMIGRGQ